MPLYTDGDRLARLYIDTDRITRAYMDDDLVFGERPAVPTRIPFPPRAPVVTESRPRSLVVAIPPSSLASKYRLHYKQLAEADWTLAPESSSAGQILTGLMPNTTYEIEAAAGNLIGWSDWSPPAIGTTGAEITTVPDKPVPPTLSNIDDVDMVARITGDPDIRFHPHTYYFRWQLEGATSWIESGVQNLLIYAITELTPISTYNVAVAIANSAGRSPWSDPTTGSTRISDPDNFIGPQVSVSPGGLTQFTAPIIPDAAVYRFGWRTGSEDPTISPEGPREYSLTLARDTEYEVQYSIKGAVGGWSNWSAFTDFRTLT